MAPGDLIGKLVRVLGFYRKVSLEPIPYTCHARDDPIPDLSFHEIGGYFITSLIPKGIPNALMDPTVSQDRELTALIGDPKKRAISETRLVHLETAKYLERVLHR